jgi:hypothetical protein
MNHNNADRTNDDRITSAIDRLRSLNAFAETLPPPSPPPPSPPIAREPRHNPDSLPCPKCGKSSLWLRGYSGEACCPHCKHRREVFDEPPWEWSGEPFIIFGKVLVVTICIVVFLVIPIMIWQSDEMKAYNAGYRAGQNGELGGGRDGPNAEYWRQGAQDGARDKEENRGR